MEQPRKESDILKSLIEQSDAAQKQTCEDGNRFSTGPCATYTEAADGTVESIKVMNAAAADLICDNLIHFKDLKKLAFILEYKDKWEKIPLDKISAVESLRKLAFIIDRWAESGPGGTMEFPPGVKKLKNLQKLKIVGCKITSGMEHIAELSALKELNVATSDIASLPAEFAKLKKLDVLQITQSKLTAFPSVVFAMPGLTYLNLAGNEIKGAIPPAVSNLTALRVLHVSQNKLSVGLEHLQTLRDLDVLTASYNDFSGPIPSELRRLVNLTVLCLDGNKFCGSVPACLGDLIKLNELHISFNRLTGVEPGALGDSLQSLDLTSNLLTVFPQEACCLRGLTKLVLTNNRMEGAIPPAISTLTALRELNVSGNKLSGGLEHVGSLQGLESLQAAGNDFCGPIPCELGQLVNLPHLQLNNNKFTGDIPASLGKLDKATSINLSSNCLTGIERGALSGTCVGSVDISKNALVGNVPAWLGELNKLVSIDLSENKLTGVEPGALGGVGMLFVNLSDNQLTELPSLQRVSGTQLPKDFSLYACGNPLPSVPPPSWYLRQLRHAGQLHLDQGIPDYSVGRDGYFLELKNPELPTIRTMVDFETWTCKEDGELDGTKADMQRFPQLYISHHEWIARADNPTALVNKIFPALRDFLQKLCEAHNPCILDAITRLWCGLTLAAKLHPTDEDVLLGYAKDIADITQQLLLCSALDNPDTFLQLVQTELCIMEYSKGDEKLWCAMHVFEAGSPIRRCMDHEFKTVLSSTAVSKIMELLFYSGLNLSDEYQRTALNHEYAIDKTMKTLACLRYAPVNLFLLEGLSKAATLLLVALTTIIVYGKQGHRSYADSTAEGFLLLMLTTQIWYEVGQLSTAQWNLKKYFSDIWNALDTIAVVLIGLWAVLSPSHAAFDVGRALLSLSAIPLSLQLLQYISMFRTIGLLVLMIKSMVLDVMVFVLVYVVSIFGFGVCFYGLFYGQSSFESSGDTLLYLFQSTLGNFDFGALSGSPFNGVGTAVLVAFLVLTSVLLVNLLIAQMSSTYSRIKDKSREEWAYVMASTVQEYVLLRERSPLCMLPPPFNAVTTLLAPLHYWALPRYKISIAGTVADYIFGIVMVPLSHGYFTLRVVIHLLSGHVLRDRYNRVRTWPFLLLQTFVVLPVYALFLALAGAILEPVAVVLTPKAAGSGGAGANRTCPDYDIWYEINRQRAAKRKVDAIMLRCNNAAVRADEQGMEMSALTSTAAVGSHETLNVLRQGAGATSSAPQSEEPNLPAKRNLPIFTEEDIHRIFPVHARHHLRREDGEEAGVARPPAEASSDTTAALEDTVDRLRAEMGEMKAALQAELRAAREEIMLAQAKQAASFAASQAEMLSLVKALVAR